ncbi:MAG: four helix bundle protein [Bacteroidota bacterium]
MDSRTYKFALNILTVVDVLPDTHRGKVIARQLTRSGTSIGANVEESRAAESRSDFIHKLNIAETSEIFII